MNEYDCVFIAALDAAALGFRVFPVAIIKPAAKELKVPTTAHGFKDAAADPQTVSHLFRTAYDKYPSDVPIVIGVVHDGMTIVDVDGQEGRDTLEKILPMMPEPFAVVSTRSGGLHYYVPHDPKMEQRRHVRWLPGIDVLSGATGFVIIPPSDGYQWLHGDLSTIARGYGL